MVDICIMIIHTLILENVMFVHVVVDHINPPSPPMTHIPLHNPLHTHSHPHPIPPNQSPSPNPLLPTHIPSHPTPSHPTPSHPNPSQPWRMGGSHVAAGRETLKQGMTFPRPFLSSSFSFGVERGRELWESEALAIFSLELFLSMHCCLECRVASELTHACLECRFESERMHACTLLLHACIFELHAWVERILLHKFRVWKVYDI